jgi:hypothetical protein
MVFRSKIGLLAAFAGLLLLTPFAGANEAPAPAGQVQLAAATLHEVQVKVDVNGGDHVTAKEFQIVIEPSAGNSNKDATAKFKGPGKAKLPAGTYRIIATYLDMRVEEKFTVGGPLTHTIAVKAGFATLKWIEKIGGKAVKDNVVWTIQSYRKTNGKRTLLSSPAGSQPRIMFPEGWYIAEATYKGKVKRLAIEIANGRQYDYVLCASC